MKYWWSKCHCLFLVCNSTEAKAGRGLISKWDECFSEVLSARSSSDIKKKVTLGRAGVSLGSHQQIQKCSCLLNSRIEIQQDWWAHKSCKNRWYWLIPTVMPCLPWNLCAEQARPPAAMQPFLPHVPGENSPVLSAQPASVQNLPPAGPSKPRTEGSGHGDDVPHLLMFSLH